MGDQNETAAAPQIPHGAMVQVGLAELDEGRFVQEINDAISRGHQELFGRREQGVRNIGVVTVKVDIQMGYDKDVSEYVSIVGQVKLSIPARRSMTLAKERAGHMLVSPGGNDSSSPDQMRLFSPDGRVLGNWDPKRGVVKPEAADGPVAGRIGGPAAANG